MKTALAAALFAGVVPGQLAKGTKAPEFDFEKAWNDGPGKFAELKGKVVLLEFFATW
ncbi:MAG: TlpA family protein disulfide reductase [Planctomycetota bacterium]